MGGALRAATIGAIRLPKPWRASRPNRFPLIPHSPANRCPRHLAPDLGAHPRTQAWSSQVRQPCADPQGSRAVVAKTKSLLDKVRLFQWLQHAILEFAPVEAFGGISTDCNADLARKVGKIRDGIPCREQLITVG